MLNRIRNIGHRLETENLLSAVRLLGMKIPLLQRFVSPLFSIRPDLLSLITSLESVMENVEPNFLRIGRELQSMYADAGRLTELTTAAARDIGCGDGCDSFLSNIDRLAKSSLADLQGYRHKISSSMSNVSQSQEHLGKLCRICSVIEKTGMSLNVIGLNIAVESSRSEQSGEMFSVFTEEIRQLSRKISGISKNILTDAGSTRNGQVSANSDILKGLETFGYLYSNAQRVVQRAIREIYGIMDMSMKVLEISNAHSREISHQVGEVVVALQFHDISRQKIEHMVLALRDIEQSCKGESREPADRMLAQFYRLLLLQQAQLKEVIAEIRGAHFKSDQAFRGLGRQVDQLVSDISVFETDQREESRIRKRISALKSGLEQLCTLLVQGKELEVQIKNTAEQVADTASQLSGHIDQVRGISMDLHLKALNAVVKSARLAAEGQVLEILAQEVSSLSRQSDNFVSDVVEILQSLVSLSLDLDLGSFDGGEADAIKELSVKDGIRELTGNYEQFKEDTSAAIRKARTLREDMLRTGSTLDFLTDLAEELNGHLIILESFTEKLEPWADKTENADAGNLEQVARRYTMKSERRLHQQYIGDTPGLLFSSHDENTEDIFESFSGNSDVENGTENDAENPHDSKGEDISEGGGRSREKADTCPINFEDAGRESVPETKEEEEDLGDNVELF